LFYLFKEEENPMNLRLSKRQQSGDRHQHGSGRSHPAGIYLILSSLILMLGMACAPSPASQPAASQSPVFPDLIPLPVGIQPAGFQPEGIAAGDGNTAYVGSIATGGIYQIDLRSGQGQFLVPPEIGRVAIGLAFDRRTGYLYVSGGPSGKAFVYDTKTGKSLAEVTLASSSTTFVNDAVVAGDAVFFTESFQPVIYRMTLNKDGSLPVPLQVDTLSLGSGYDFVPGGFNANGIDATPDAKQVVIVNSTTGALYLVDPQSGAATPIDLGGDTVTLGDGILLDGKTLYVVRNQANEIAVVDLSPDLSSGKVRPDRISSPDFDIPTTLAEFGNSLYAVNARFSTSPTPDTEYQVVRVTKVAGK
jgi:hypothetical protein